MRLLPLFIVAGLAAGASAQFTPGNLVVRIVGDGDATTVGAMATRLREYAMAGSQVGSDVSLNNVAGGRNVCCSYGETSEGSLEVSDDGKYLVFAGYDVPVRDPGFDIFNSSRVVGRVRLTDGQVSLSVPFVPTVGDGCRGVWSPDGDNYIVCGGDMGLLQGTFGTVPTQILSTPTSSRNIREYGSEFVFNSSNGGPIGNNALLTFNGVSQSLLFPTPNDASSRQFYRVDPSTYYVTTSTNAQGLMKVGFNATTGMWELLYQLGGVGVNGLVVDGPTLYLTRSNGAEIVKTTDTGTMFTALQTVAVAEANTRCRGLVMVPATGSAETLAPVAENLNLGRFTGGSLASWANDDGDARRIVKFIVPNASSPFVRCTLDYVTTKSSPVSLEFDSKARALNAGAFVIKLLLQNKANGSFVEVKPETAIGTTYAVYNGGATGNLADYVGTGGTVTGRIELRQVGPSAAALPGGEFDTGLVTVTD